jgi:Pretoxin HINT domain/Bacterial toxin 24
VLSDDPTTPGGIEYKQVVQTFVRETNYLVDVYIGGEKITTTENHPFWVKDVGWVAARDLNAGAQLQTKSEAWLGVERVEKHTEVATVYNFEVQGFHTYFVSDLGLLVHNACLIPDPNAQGPHTVFKLDNKTNKIRGYEEFVPNTSNYPDRYNPQFPKPWISVKRVDIEGAAHNGVPTPHVNGKDLPGGVRPALSDEIPANTIYPKTPGL